MFLLLIAGMPATGKTTAMHAIAKELCLPSISKDTLKELLFDTIGFRSRQEKEALGHAAIQAAYHLAEQCLSVGQSCALESNFGSADIPAIESICRRHNAHPITLHLDCPVELAYERFIERDQSPLRHRGHVVNTQFPQITPPPPYQAMPLSAFAAAMEERGIRAFHVGQSIVVDTSDFSAVNWTHIARQIVRKIPS